MRSKRAAKKKDTYIFMYIFKLFETNRMIVFGEKKKEIKKWEYKNRRWNKKKKMRKCITKKKFAKEKMGTTKKTRKQREKWKRYRNKWASSFKQLDEKKDNKRRDQTQREKTRWDQAKRCKNKTRSKRKWIFWTSWHFSDSCRFWSRFFSFSQKKQLFSQISVLALSFL